MNPDQLNALLQSTSNALFPAEMGRAEVSITSRSADGDTPLHVLLWRKDAHGALALIEAGADPNAIGDMGETPLHVAVRQNLSDVVQALLDAGGRLTIRSEFNQTPMETATTPVRNKSDNKKKNASTAETAPLLRKKKRRR